MDDLIKLYIEATSRCNLNCSMCFRNTWIDEPFADMDAAVFEAAMRTMPPTVSTVFFGGMGEPLFHKDIVGMIRHAAGLGKRVELVTNATLLTRETARNLLDAGLSMLWVSIESFEAGSYESIRKDGDLELVQENIRAFNRERAKLDQSVRLGVNFVVMKSNIHQLKGIPRFVSRFQVNEVNVSNLIPSNAESLAQIVYDKVVDWGVGTPGADAAEIRLPMMNWREEGVMEGVRDILASGNGIVSISGRPLVRKTNHCRFVDEGMAFVRHDGNVSPCMGLLHSAVTYWNGWERVVRHHSFGNVLSQGLHRIWSSAEYSRFRERVRQFDFSPCIKCSGCDLWEKNEEDCFGNGKPTCGACLWAEGVVSCP